MAHIGRTKNATRRDSIWFLGPEIPTDEVPLPPETNGGYQKYDRLHEFP